MALSIYEKLHKNYLFIYIYETERERGGGDRDVDDEEGVARNETRGLVAGGGVGATFDNSKSVVE